MKHEPIHITGFSYVVGFAFLVCLVKSLFSSETLVPFWQSDCEVGLLLSALRGHSSAVDAIPSLSM